MEDLFETPVGDLRIVEVFLCYDGPQVFSCVDMTGQYYLAHLVDCGDRFTRYFLVPMSPERLEKVRTGGLDLRRSIILAETRWFWDLRLPHNGEQSQALVRSVVDLPEDDLPAEGIRLAAHGRRLPVLSDDPVTLAQRTQRDLLLVTVKSENHGQRIDADHAARVLIGVQELVGLLAAPAAKRLTRLVADVNTLCLVGLFSGSVGMTLESKYPADLAGTYTADSLSALIGVLKAGDDPEALGAILPGLRKGARRRYRFLLRSLNKAGSGLGAVWASPLGTREDADVAFGQVSRIMEIMGGDEEDSVYEFQTHGSLVLIRIVEETKKRKGRTVFEFVSDEGDWFKGTLDDSLIDRVRTKGLRFLVPAHDVDAKIQEITEVNPVTGDETVAYVLVDISRLPGETV